ncbi:Aryl carrier domain-containing protein [Palleronia marisminoris]|uniref:Vibriobactin-specific isochorismatase n=1 Tax=Palleronia marisminoris TaxID=315423 RepID=A0A1Y5SU21_9RHOB|nr:phosphopantetheine-binding protein [Palleronia marisminoris]SFG94635.1 Aryl carrier domain-containing protein [Palleronia marisminoris]SLN46499.1 Vibriobactin-specific isochorismatase [Palleronia marisminoris]
MTGQLTLEIMRRDIAEALRMPPEEIADDNHLGDLGLDSVALMQLLMRWEELQPSIEPAHLYEAETLAEWWAIVQAGRA